jgi:hypothetical protein
MLRRRWAPALLSVAALLAGAATLEAQMVSVSSGNTFHTNDATVSAGTFTVTCAGGYWNATNHIRLLIPSTLNMSWDTSVLGAQVTYGGLMASHMVTGPPVVSYGIDVNGNKVVQLNVASIFTATQSVTIDGLKFTSFGAPSSGQIGAAYDGGASNTWNIQAAQIFTIVSNPTVQNVNPAADQAIDPPPQPAAVTLSDLRITDGNPPGIWNTKKLRISIPVAAGLTWDTTMTSVGIQMNGGGASVGTVSTAISNPASFEDGNRTIILNVTNTFAAGEFVTVSSLRFAAPAADTANFKLYVTTNGPGAETATGKQATSSNNTRILGQPKISIPAGNQVYTVGDLPTAPQINVTSACVTPTKITSANGIRIVIPGTLNMQWDQTVQQLADGLIFGGTGAPHVTAAAIKVTYPTSRTALIALQSDFGTNETLTVQGLKFTSIAGGSPAQALTLNTIAAVATTPQTIAIGAPAIASQVGAGGQIFSVDPNPATTIAAADILVSDDAQIPAVNRITTQGIRIRIPVLPAPTPSLVWDTTVTTVTCSGNAQVAGFMLATAGVTYEDAGKTAVIAVQNNWTGNSRSVLIHGLVFKNFTAPMTPRKLGLCVGPAGGTICANDTRNIAIGGTPKLDSLNNQAFTFNDPITNAAQITVKDAGGVPTITTVNDITIKIPAAFPMSWDTTRQRPIDGLGFSGLAFTNNRITTVPNTTVVITYPDAKTAVITVTSNFAADEDLVITGMRFQNFNGTHPFDNLQLFVDPLGAAILDSKTIGVGKPTIALASSQTFGAGDPSTALSQMTIAEDPNVARIQSNGILIHIPAGLNMSWDQSVQTLADGLVFGGTGGPAHLTGAAVKVSYPTAKIALINLATGFNPNDTLTIDGLKVMSFVGTTGPLGLDLEVNNSGTICNTSINTLSTGTRPQLLSMITRDTNGNGSIDQIVLTFDKTLDPTGVSATTGQGFTISAPSYTIGVASVSGTVLTLSLVEKGVPDTGVRPMVTYNPSTGPTAGDLHELGTGLEIAFTGPQQAADGAAPVITGLTTLDSNNDGHLDKITVTFSETLAPNQEDILDWKIFDADGTTNLLQGLTSLTIVGNTVEFVLSGATGTTGTPRFVYVDNPSNPKRIQDAAGNFTVYQTNNAPPTIQIASNNISVGPSKITLDASASTDPQGQPLSFSWMPTSWPGGATVNLVNASTATPFFLGTTAGLYTFQVTVSNALTSATAIVTVTIVNIPPGADAGSPQTVTQGAAITTYLVALSSLDANESSFFTLNFNWTQLGGATALPSSPTGVVTTFTAPVPNNNPLLPANNILTYQVAVSDGVNTSLAQTQVRVNAAGVKAPTANAGPDQVVYVGSTVQLDGSLSVDPANLPLTYKWTSPTPLTPAAGNIVNPTFVPPLPGIYSFSLTVTNNYPLASFPATVRILAQSPTNQAPEAVAHRLQPTGEIVVGDLVVLDGTGSKDPEGTPITYAWTQTAGPTVILDNPAALRPAFTPVKPATYSFQLVTSDGVNHSFPAPVSLTVKDSPGGITWTTAISKGSGFGGNGHATAGVTFTLNFTVSDPTPGVPYYYYLEQLEGPAADINTTTTNEGQLSFPPTTFYNVTAPKTGYYVFRLAAENQSLVRAFSTIGIVVDAAGDSTPLADAGPPPTPVTAGTLVTLDATLSQNAPATTFAGLRSYWVQREGTPVTLSDPYSATPTFTPIAAGQYTFELKVADATANSQPSFTVITVQPSSSGVVSGGGGGSGGCGILGMEWMLLLPLVWLASWLRSRVHARRRAV